MPDAITFNELELLVNVKLTKNDRKMLDEIKEFFGNCSDELAIKNAIFFTMCAYTTMLLCAQTKEQLKKNKKA